MTPSERKLLDKIDNLVLESSPEELKKIQKIDLLTQMDGGSFYDSYNNFPLLSDQKVKKESKET